MQVSEEEEALNTPSSRKRNADDAAPSPASVHSVPRGLKIIYGPYGPLIDLGEEEDNLHEDPEDKDLHNTFADMEVKPGSNARPVNKDLGAEDVETATVKDEPDKLTTADLEN